ncbi:hypothetical protein BD410DRAFT_809397 [Rickenella mellea]|uniref:Uncharacterized protein n=1 Tax=Rickenella mellea TaxID=50990 RepID=A0A4Y7PHV6_9AGAM|nr:hypothetical protein BD410DRAFT_809397 [Rickenella mellea]
MSTHFRLVLGAETVFENLQAIQIADPYHNPQPPFGDLVLLLRYVRGLSEFLQTSRENLQTITLRTSYVYQRRDTSGWRTVEPWNRRFSVDWIYPHWRVCCLDETGQNKVLRMLTDTLLSSNETISTVVCPHLEEFDIGTDVALSKYTNFILSRSYEGAGNLRRVVYSPTGDTIELNADVKECIKIGLIVTPHR